MKIRTKLKTKHILNKIDESFCKFLYWIFTPYIKICEGLDKKKREKLQTDSYYKQRKLEKLLYKTIQNMLMREDELYIFDTKTPPIDTDIYDWNYINIDNLLRRSDYLYLTRYAYRVRKKSVSYDEWFNIVKNFDNDDIRVEEVSKDEAFSYMKYKQYDPLYRQSNKILKILKIL